MRIQTFRPPSPTPPGSRSRPSPAALRQHAVIHRPAPHRPCRSHSEQSADSARVRAFTEAYGEARERVQGILGIAKDAEGLWDPAAKHLISVRDARDHLIASAHICRLLQTPIDGEAPFVPSASYLARFHALLAEVTDIRRIDWFLSQHPQQIQVWNETTPLAEALSAKRRFGFAQLVVRRDENQRLALVTNYGLSLWLAHGTKPLAEARLSDVLQFEDRSTWIVLSPQDFLGKVLDVFREQTDAKSATHQSRRKIWRVLVTNDGKVTGNPIGIIHPRDVAELETRLWKLRHQTAAQIGEQTPAERQRVEQFLEAYNRLETGLKATLHSEKGIGRLLVDARAIVATVDQNFDLLNQLGWIRAAIIHNFIDATAYDFVPSEAFLRFFGALVGRVLAPIPLARTFGREIQVFPETTPFLEILGLIERERFGQVVCRDTTTRRLFLITHEGINSFLESGRSPATARASDLRALEPTDITAFFGPDTGRSDAVRTFRETNAAGLPRYWAGLITHDGSNTGNLIGIVTPYDIATNDC